MNDDNILFLRSKLNEVDKLKEIQIKNIDRGFEELIRRLEEKKFNLKNDFSQKYEREKMRLEDTMKPYLLVQNRLEAVKHTYNELSEMLMQKTSAFVLGKIQDVMTKMKQSSDTLQDLYL
jgi:ABC-type phosphate transport system auxiliary subunit